MNFYIADTHFGHENILGLDNRPFKTIDEHDEALIEYWNDAVGYNDDVYILGDFCMYSTLKTQAILKRLNGRKHLIVGNHDGKSLKNPETRNMFVEITPYKEITDGEHFVVLSHFPIPTFNKHYYGAYHFYGHVHKTEETNIIKHTQELIKAFYGEDKCNMYNVGCMVQGYRPRTFAEITGKGVKV